MCGNHRQEKAAKFENTEESKIAKDKEFAELVEQGGKKGKPSKVGKSVKHELKHQ